MRDFKNLKIAVAGTGYVGLSIATLLAQHRRVTAVDVVPDKVEKINRGVSPIQDDYLEQYLPKVVNPDGEKGLRATLDGREAYADADFVVIAAPTNYDSEKNFFDTSHVEEVIDLVREVNPGAVMVIKSTIPVGYCRQLYKRYGKGLRLIFSPEFLRESKALYDNLYPSRIIVGVPKLFEVDNLAELQEAARLFASLLVEGSKIAGELNPGGTLPLTQATERVLFMGSTEAEAVKLFANT